VRRALTLVYVSSFAALTSFYLMLGITPLYAISGGQAELGGALTTTVFMLATVAAELVTTDLMRRIGQQATLAIGIVLLGLPAFALLISDALALILAVSAIRGAGFALVIIAGGAMVASLTDESRHGRGLALYGIAVGIPSIVALPFGVWLVEQVGFAPLFVVSGVVAVLGVLVPLVRIEIPRPDEVHGLVRTLRKPGVLRLAIVFGATTLAAGVFLTWAPITGGDAHGSLIAALALLAFGLASTITRWVAGRIGDRTSPTVLLVPGLLILGAGLALTALVPGAILPGSLVLGAGLGLIQNATLQLMMKSAGASGYGAASAIWNIAYDIGLAVGAFGFGLLAATYGLSLLVSAALVASAIAVLAFWRSPASSASSQVTRG